MDADVFDRTKGALVGLAIGGALGTTLEFSQRDRKPHHSEMLGGGPFGLKPGQWTDDTSMALALGESLVERDGFDPHDLMSRFLSWYRTGTYSCTGRCFDIGNATREALERYERTNNPYAGSDHPHSAGNGSPRSRCLRWLTKAKHLGLHASRAARPTLLRNVWRLATSSCSSSVTPSGREKHPSCSQARGMDQRASRQ